jgi:hypothetical protein
MSMFPLKDVTFDHNYPRGLKRLHNTHYTKKNTIIYYVYGGDRPISHIPRSVHVAGDFGFA